MTKYEPIRRFICPECGTKNVNSPGTVMAEEVDTFMAKKFTCPDCRMKGKDIFLNKTSERVMEVSYE